MSGQAEHPPFHVFLSFRGPDTRERFTCLLHDALTRAGYRTFMDDEDIRAGEEIGARIRTTPEYLCIPIYYYGVEPADVKFQRGTFGQGLEKLSKRYGHELEKWRAALGQVGSLKGTIVAGKLDKFLHKIVEEIGEQLIMKLNLQPQTSSLGTDQQAARMYLLNLIQQKSGSSQPVPAGLPFGVLQLQLQQQQQKHQQLRHVPAAAIEEEELDESDGNLIMATRPLPNMGTSSMSSSLYEMA
ncbi:hypothetical protein RJ639_036866 [Escallonia herrerae]|uniref:ADP-ribosyl cyclase/cyclic ADP-ribose hydrolase n=1 Tax=Escallonia herrerae TaxID=1293975 RepID=A0AA88WNH2_9ASTE|nr:hypothetical protein RJ639_036866 [Escallonia herrerae]